MRNVIIFSTADWDNSYWTNKQHMAIEYSKNFNVYYINSFGLRKLKFSIKDFKRIIFRIFGFFIKKKLTFSNNIKVFNFFIFPFYKGFKPILKLNNLLIKFQLRKYIINNEVDSALIISYHPYLPNFDFKRVNFQYKTIYHAVDDLSSIPSMNVNNFKVIEMHHVRNSDYVFTTSKNLFNRFKKINHNTFQDQNVVDLDFFKQTLTYRNTKLPKKVLFMGALSEFKINFKLLLDIICTNKKITFKIIGDEIEGQNNKILKKILIQKNVEYLGFQSYENLPSLMSDCFIGLIPCISNSYTNNMFPMKFYEYISAGLFVISTPLDFSQIIKPNKFTYFAKDAQDFSKLINSINIKEMPNSSDIDNIVGQNSWSGRINKFNKIIFANEDFI